MVTWGPKGILMNMTETCAALGSLDSKSPGLNKNRARLQQQAGRQELHGGPAAFLPEDSWRNGSLDSLLSRPKDLDIKGDHLLGPLLKMVKPKWENQKVKRSIRFGQVSSLPSSTSL